MAKAKNVPEDVVIEDTTEIKSETENVVIENATEIKRDEIVIYFKAIKPLTTQEHENLHEKIEVEMKSSGLKVILVPFLVDLVDSQD
ncbi:hypothetical protein CDLVIII_1339 [Clostridium sp. DL-VIII]|uniref:hypothetical protein n=1 Tax=Clostridium sp. DL-VIII TaxID=641107 RepID=UPI00023AF83A|nr:hypothetical protein [Clostridium sp. DL-VIII]EHI98038.1 hypothetical protein CDLVIII_1339 [Clostridium sp. DL-VIII]